MKKIWLVMLGLVFAISACAINEIDTKEFKNPLFNQPLEPLSKISTLTYITPTSIEARTPLDKNLIALTGNCKLIENQENHIAMSCDIKYNHPEENEIYKKYYVFEIGKLIMKDCLVIQEKVYENLEDYTKSKHIGYESYCVTPPKIKTSNF